MRGMESPGVYCLVDMRAGLAAFIDLVMPIDSSSQPPQILQIVREPFAEEWIARDPQFWT